MPGLRVIACHFGGYHRLDEAEDLLVGSRAVLETSWPPSTAGLDPARIREIIARHGADRVVYGSDWPMTDPAAEIAAIRALGLPPEDEAAVLGGNLAALLGILPRPSPPRLSARLEAVCHPLVRPVRRRWRRAAWPKRRGSNGWSSAR